MSQNSYNDANNYNQNVNNNYGDTFKQGGESGMTNVFSQNLGQTGPGYNSYNNNYKNEINRRGNPNQEVEIVDDERGGVQIEDGEAEFIQNQNQNYDEKNEGNYTNNIEGNIVNDYNEGDEVNENIQINDNQEVFQDNINDNQYEDEAQNNPIENA